MKEEVRRCEIGRGGGDTREKEGERERTTEAIF